MRVLAIDTTAAFGSLALMADGALVEEMPLHSPEGFGHILFDRIEALLTRHGWTVRSVDCFAAAAGPGSFTGVRVGLAAVKGLAEATGKLAAAVSNLQALASYGTGPVRAVVMDARRGEVYGAVFNRDLQEIQPAVVTPFPRWMESLPSEVSDIISPDFAPFRASFPLQVPVVEQRAIAGAVARLAAGRCVDPALVDADYVRRSDAELNWTDAV